MTIHFENYKTYSKGQGFIGALCRPVSPQAKSTRWKAVDCTNCREQMKGRRIISRTGQVGNVVEIRYAGAEIQVEGDDVIQFVNPDAFDHDWAPFPSMDLIFPDVTSTANSVQ